jgi:uncharacterized alpha-E superfamily protein
MAMLCRHADAAYWIGRYIERAEATARMIDVHYHFGLESPLIGDALRWSSLLPISGQEDLYRKLYGDAEETAILNFFAFDERNPSSIASCILFARENSRSIRDQISSEMWTCVNRFFIQFREWNLDRLLSASLFQFFDMVKEGSQLFQGVTNRTLMMGETRDFHDAGRFLERADQTARILDVKYHDLLPEFSDTATLAPKTSSEAGTVGGVVDLHGWNAVLRSVGAREAFLKTHRQGVSPARVAQFLILNPQFPASVRHGVGRVEGCLRRISSNRDLAPANVAERETGRLYSELNFMTAEDIVAGGLHEFLETVQERCNRIGEAIYKTYLRY